MKFEDIKKVFKKAPKQEATRTVMMPKASKSMAKLGSVFKARDIKPNFYIGVFLNTIKILGLSLFVFAAIGFGALWGIAKAYLEQTPTLNTDAIANQAETTYLYDMNGDFLAAYVGSENREWASSDEIPDMLKNAFVSVEDVRFYYHNGIDLKRLVGAAISNFLNESVQGGSTITQQLIKNTILSFERTYKRKIQEAFLAIQLEQEYSKDEILVSYLNTIDLGGGNYGVKAAASDYLGKDLDELTIKECAMIAGITQYPYAYNPRRCYYGSGNPEALESRIELVLNRMYEAGYITKAELEEAMLEEPEIVEESTVHSMYQNAYFVEYAIDEVITKMLEARGLKTDDDANRDAIEEEIRTSGYRIYTTMDPEVQDTVEDSLSTWDKYPSTAKSSDSTTTSKNSDGSITETIQPQAAAVVYDYTTGQLRGIVGGRDDPEVLESLNRVNATMPVGSSIKPLAVYAPALDLGLSPATIIDNIPVAIDGWDTATGYPATSESTFGPRTLRYGITNSINILTAKILMENVGLETAKEYLISMGISTKHISTTPAGLALGTSGITPLEMAVAYGCLANSGEYIEPISFTLITDSDGNVILDNTESQESRQVFKESTAWLIVDLLEDVVEKGTGKNARISGMTVGGKTGTNQENRGIYFCGITPYYSASLWVGHDDYKPLKSNAYASSYAAPLWQDFMSEIHEDLEDKDIIDATPASLGLVSATVCPVSGLLATENCTKDLSGRSLVTDWFTRDTVPTEYCDTHLPVSAICAVSNKLATENCPEEQQIEASLVLLDSDSPYFLLDSELLASLMPLAFPKLESGSIDDLTPESEAYYTYYCDVHTDNWLETTKLRPNAVSAAETLIAQIDAYLATTQAEIAAADYDALLALIESLNNLIENASSTSSAISTKTDELTDAYQALLDKYPEPEEEAEDEEETPESSPTPTPTSSPSPTETLDETELS
jgi:penicillin-binding protein 1A